MCSYECSPGPPRTERAGALRGRSTVLLKEARPAIASRRNECELRDEMSLPLDVS